MFEKFKNMFDKSKSEEPDTEEDGYVYNKFASEQTPEGHALTGRREQVSDDMATPIEKVLTPEERLQRIHDGVLDIMKSYGVRSEEVLGMQDFFIKELVKLGVLSEKDTQFDVKATLSDVLNDIARRKAA